MAGNTVSGRVQDIFSCAYNSKGDDGGDGGGVGGIHGTFLHTSWIPKS